MDQARARVSALQLARLEESSRRMATSLRRVEPKENQDPENHLIPGDWSTSRFREKTELHIVPPHPRRQIKPTTPMPIFLWDKLLDHYCPDRDDLFIASNAASASSGRARTTKSSVRF